MTQEVFPETQAAALALEKRIELTEGEIAKLNETVTAKKQLVRGWKKAIATFNHKPGQQGKKAAAKT